MPLSLKEWLIDDFDAIMQQNKVIHSLFVFFFFCEFFYLILKTSNAKLLKVPCSKTVGEILDDYAQSVTNNKNWFCGNFYFLLN